MIPNEIYHVYNRGNNKQPIFFSPENYLFFLEKVKRYLNPNCDLLAYSLMTNHFHFLIAANDRTNQIYSSSHSQLKLKEPNKRKIELTLFSRGLQILLSSYSKSINQKMDRTGSLFQQNTKVKQTSSDSFLEDYSLWCFIYIHNNAQACGLVKSPEDYEFSSYKDYLMNRNDSICNIALARKLLSLDMADLFNQKNLDIPDDILPKIISPFD